MGSPSHHTPTNVAQKCYGAKRASNLQEFSQITADSTGIALLPFPRGRPSEHAFRLTAVAPGHATFEAPEHDFPKRIRYSRDADGSLIARIDDGADSLRSQEWRMKPMACRPAGG